MKKIMMFCLAALLLVAFTAPAMAATNKATFYGNVRMWQYIEKKDKETSDDFFDFNESDSDLLWDSDFYNSRFGIKLNEGKIKANLEVRPWNAYYFRQFWASYAFTDNVEMIFGFTWSPFFCPVTKFAWTGGGIEGIWGDMVSCLRTYQVGFKLKFPFGRAHIALEPPNVADVNDFTTDDSDTYIPRIEANFTFALGPASLGVFGGLNKYDVWNKTSDKEETITSYMYGIRIEVPVGPLSLRGLAYKGQNEGNYGYAFVPSAVIPRYAYNPKSETYIASYVNNKIEDTTTTGFAVAAGFQFNDMVGVDVGYGWAKYEGYASWEDPGAFYYIAFPITIAKGFTVQPEAGVLDLKDYTDGNNQSHDQGQVTVFGLYWMINF